MHLLLAAMFAMLAVVIAVVRFYDRDGAFRGVLEPEDPWLALSLINAPLHEEAHLFAASLKVRELGWASSPRFLAPMSSPSFRQRRPTPAPGSRP